MAEAKKALEATIVIDPFCHILASDAGVATFKLLERDISRDWLISEIRPLLKEYKILVCLKEKIISTLFIPQDSQ